MLILYLVKWVCGNEIIFVQLCMQLGVGRYYPPDARVPPLCPCALVSVSKTLVFLIALQCMHWYNHETQFLYKTIPSIFGKISHQ